MAVRLIKLTKRNPARTTSGVVIDVSVVGAVTKSLYPPGTFILAQGKWVLVTEDRDEVLRKLGWEVRV